MCFFPKPIHITEKIAPVLGQSKESERWLLLPWDIFVSRDWREVDSKRKEAKGRLLLWGGSSQLQGENMNLLFGKSSCWVVTNNTKSRFMSSRTWNGLWFLKEEKKSIESMLRDHRMARKPGEQGSHKGQGQNLVRLELGWVEMCVLPISSSLHIGPDQQAENWQWRVVQLYWSKLQEHSRSKLQEQSGEPLSWIRLQKFLEASS